MAKIRVLPPEEARKIAAGEVIDRPCALVREFIDNALDSGAKTVEVCVEEGGCRLVEVSDDGSGMDRDDLALCVEDHATSKITRLDDLCALRTLGFRGEALPAASAVAEIEIITSQTGEEAWRLSVHHGVTTIEKTARAKGTTVRARFLFDYIPARKRFLKRSASEAALCKQVFLEKAAAFPLVQFRFVQDGELKVFLPAPVTLKERFASAFKLERYISLLHHITGSGEGFTLSIIAGGPGLSRPDKRLQMVFANGRRISDWGLLQAFESGLQGGFPNADHPVGAVFLDIAPGLVDFNIHPAKREAKFEKAGDIHHTVTTTLRGFLPGLLHRLPSTMQSRPQPGLRLPAQPPKKPDTAYMDALVNQAVYEEKPPSGTIPESSAAEAAPSYAALKFIGRLWGLFILVEKDGRLYIIDQHAAHEQILYQRYIANPIAGEPLLIPLRFSVDTAEEDAFLLGHTGELSRLGLRLERDAPHVWRLETVPAGWHAADGETVKAIRELPSNGTNFVASWAATCACHTAVRDGAFIDEKTALALARDIMASPVHCCPHGRPVWVEITREELLKGVKRL
jgi:DNA mismatch repair protein MutL